MSLSTERGATNPDSSGLPDGPDKAKWHAPESNIESEFPEDRLIRVTDRTYGRILDEISLSEEQLKGKKIISIANGFSDFVEKCNRLEADTQCVGADPVYSELVDDFSEFEARLLSMGLKVNPQVSSVYEKFKQGIHDNSYVAADAEHLPFTTSSVDLVVLSHLIDYIDDIILVENIIMEVARILKEGGELRISDILFVLNSDNNTLSLDYDGQQINYQSNAKYLKLFKSLAEKGLRLYAVKFIMSERLRPRNLESCENDIYRGVIIRKDAETPETTLHYDSGSEKTDGVKNPLLEIEPIEEDGTDSIRAVSPEKVIANVSPSEQEIEFHEIRRAVAEQDKDQNTHRSNGLREFLRRFKKCPRSDQSNHPQG